MVRRAPPRQAPHPCVPTPPHTVALLRNLLLGKGKDILAIGTVVDTVPTRGCPRAFSVVRRRLQKQESPTVHNTTRSYGSVGKVPRDLPIRFEFSIQY